MLGPEDRDGLRPLREARSREQKMGVRCWGVAVAVVGWGKKGGVNPGENKDNGNAVVTPHISAVDQVTVLLYYRNNIYIIKIVCC